MNIQAVTPDPHAFQRPFLISPAKRKIVRAGRRSGKTEGAAILAVDTFTAGKRVLYAVPTEDQVDSFWASVTNSLGPLIDAGVLKKNETRHTITLPKTKMRIRAKTAWNADTLRGDFADLLILDEFQLMDEDAWELVGAPMLLDNNGDAVFIYTPPSLRSRSISKARDPKHAASMYRKAVDSYAADLAANRPPLWQPFHWTSHDNPHISTDALAIITADMTPQGYRMEILAEDLDEAPGALWTRAILEATRVTKGPTQFLLIVVGVDPSATSTGDEAGIIVAGLGSDGDWYILEDDSIQGSPLTWATAAVSAYHRWQANRVVAEVNNGGEMVLNTIANIDKEVFVEKVTASRGKATRAEPISAVFQNGRAHLFGSFPYLEDELVLWIPGTNMASPNRLDAMVWACSRLMHAGSMPSTESLDRYGRGEVPDPRRDKLSEQLLTYARASGVKLPGDPK